MTRRLLNLLTALSLLLCMAVTALWVRSGVMQYSLRRSVGDRHIYGLKAYRGTLLLTRTDLSTDSALASGFTTFRWDADPVEPELGYEDNGDSIDSVVWRKAGRFRLGYSTEPFIEGVVQAAVVPLWLVAAVTSLLPAVVALRGWRHRRRRRRSLCPQCGYSLTGNLSGVCPECGKVIQAGT